MLQAGNWQLDLQDTNCISLLLRLGESLQGCDKVDATEVTTWSLIFLVSNYQTQNICTMQAPVAFCCNIPWDERWWHWVEVYEPSWTNSFLQRDSGVMKKQKFCISRLLQCLSHLQAQAPPVMSGMAASLKSGTTISHDSHVGMLTFKVKLRPAGNGNNVRFQLEEAFLQVSLARGSASSWKETKRKSRSGQAPGRLGKVGMSHHLLREPQSALRVVKKDRDSFSPKCVLKNT